MFSDQLSGFRAELSRMIEKLDADQKNARKNSNFELAKSIGLIKDMATALKNALVVSQGSLRQDFLEIAAEQLEAIKSSVQLLEDY